MTALLLLGDSHCAAISAALRERPPGAGLDLRGGPLGAASLFHHPFYRIVDGTLVWTHQQLTDNAQRWRAATGVDDPLQGPGRLVVSLGLASAPFYGHRLWSRFSLSGEDGQHLSRGVVGAMVLAMQSEVLRFYTDLAGRGLLHAAVAAPAPQRRHRAVERLGAQTVLELDQLFRTPVERLLAELGVPVVDVPETRDEEGLLKTEFWGGDPSHGNAAFGRLLVEELLRSRRQDRLGQQT